MTNSSYRCTGFVQKLDPVSRNWRFVERFDDSNPRSAADVIIVQPSTLLAMSNSVPFLKIHLENIVDFKPSKDAEGLNVVRVLLPTGVDIYGFRFLGQTETEHFSFYLSNTMKALSYLSSQRKHPNGPQAFAQTGSRTRKILPHPRDYNDVGRTGLAEQHIGQNPNALGMKYPTMPHQDALQGLSQLRPSPKMQFQRPQQQNAFSPMNINDDYQMMRFIPTPPFLSEPMHKSQEPFASAGQLSVRKRTEAEPSHQRYPEAKIQNYMNTEDGFQVYYPNEAANSGPSLKQIVKVVDGIGGREETDSQLASNNAEQMPKFHKNLSKSSAATPTTNKLRSGSDISINDPSNDPKVELNVKEDVSEKQPKSLNDNQTLDALCDLLAEAIDVGNTEKAKEMAAELTNMKAKLTIQMLCQDKERMAVGSTIHVTVQIEDKQTTKPTLVKLDLNPAETTIGNLKYMFFQKYQFPIKVQRWIVGKRLPEDSVKLNSLGVKTTGTVIFLYLLSAKQAEVSVEDQDKREPEKAESSNFPLMKDIPGESVNVSGKQPPFNPFLHTFHGGPMSENRTGPNQFADRNPSHRKDPNSFYQRIGSLQSPTLPYPLGFNHPMEANHSFKEFAPGGAAEQLQGQPKSMQNEDILLLLDHNQDNPVPLIPPPVPPRKHGWICRTCTFVNLPTRPGCEMCGSDRPQDYNPPPNVNVDEKERERLRREAESEQILFQLEEQQREQERLAAMSNYQNTLQTAQMNLIHNPEDFECPICFTEVPAGQGAMLRECLHTFCRDCLVEHIKASEDPEIRCPYNDVQPCDEMITGQEISALLSEEDYMKYLDRSLNTAENKAENSFHCKTPNCKGWCIYEDEVNWFPCPLCKKRNCLTCKAIHEKQTCKEYQDDIKIRAENDEAARKTQKMLDDMLKNGNAMNCPQCKILVQKKDGCDWIRCSMCRTEICWVTRGRRWGPNGQGDTSGGCRCRVNGVPCHPRCGNCH